MRSLDMSANNIGYDDSIDPRVTVALGENLGKLTELQELYLNGNAIGAADGVTTEGTQALARGIGSLSTLEYLDLSVNPLGSGTESNVTDGLAALGSALPSLRRLRTLNMAKWRNMLCD